MDTRARPDHAAEAIRVLRAEAAAISAAADRLASDPSGVVAAVEVLERCTGKVVVVGAGTSGIIARKVAAIFTSTGTPATFLHPGDALHGGLGMVTPGDVVVLVSNSGETDELIGLLPYLGRRGVPLVGILGKTDSTLGRACQVVVDAGADHEACPLDLAPTSSSTLALAIGDAFAVAVFQSKGLTAEAFALNHPSGRLGRRLTLRVDDVASAPGHLPSVPPSAPWLDVIGAITEGGAGAVVVVDGRAALLGIVTDGDVRRTVQRTPPDALATTVAETMMTSAPVSVRQGTLAFEALRMMEDRASQISVLPVVDEQGRCTGIVRVHDLVRAGL